MNSNFKKATRKIRLKLPPPLAMLKSNKGMALLLAIFSLTTMLFIASEVFYDTNIEYVISAQRVNRLKAHYAAKSGVEISLLRILIYKKAMAAFGEQLGDNTTMLDPIWQFPFAWPPVFPDDLATVEKDIIKSVVKESSFDAQYVATIEAEGSKIDVNDMGSPSKGLAKSTREQVLRVFTQEIENNDKFRQKHDGEDFEQLVNNIADWVDEDKEGLNGGDEKSPYSDRVLQSEFIPPNQGFKTIEELHMVAGMKDDFYELLVPKITIYGVKGININYSDANTLKSIDAQFTDEVVGKIVTRRSSPEEGGPFSDDKDFFSFLDSIGVDSESFNESGVPLLFEPELNFRVISIGNYGSANKEITAITYDTDNLKERLIKILDQEEKAESDADSDEDKEKQKADEAKKDSDKDADEKDKDKDEKKKKPKIKIPEGRPRVVYWHES